MWTKVHVLGRPGFTGAVLVLALNDHFLKEAAPGWATGKLSDFAGLFVIAVLTGVVLDRVRVALAVTGIGFAALKLSTPVAVLAAPLLGGVTRRDPTDLLALVALWPAAIFLRRSGVPAGATYRRVAFGFVAAATAVFATTATSCERPYVVMAFAAEGETLFAQIPRDPRASGPRDDVRWAVSRDGGKTWERADAPSGVEATPRLEECAGATCYRVVPGERVEQLSGAEWVTAFEYSAEERRRLDLRHSSCGVSDDEDLFRSVTAVRTAEGTNVVVAMGTQGVVHRAPGGEWERRAVLDLEPLPLSGPSWLWHLRWTPLALLAIAPLVLHAGNRAYPERKRHAGVLAIGGVAILFWPMILGIFIRPLGDYAIFGPFVTAASLVLFVVSLVRFGKGREPAPPNGSGG